MNIAHFSRICNPLCVGCFHASFERHFVKNFLNLLSFHRAFHQYYIHDIVGAVFDVQTVIK